KYLFPGIAGPDIINFTHWLGALVTSMRTVGIKDTPVRRVIERAAEFVTCPLLCMALVLHAQDGRPQGPPLHSPLPPPLQNPPSPSLWGLYIGPHAEAFNAAADLSS